MSTVVTIWDGEEWQKYITTLLGLRFGARYQPIPDRDQGDWGLEGYCDDGCVYQCYAATEPIDVAELTDKQRNKITQDIGKFCTNASQLKKIFGPLRITHWVLMVPRCESKRILLHAEKKAAEVRALNLAIVGSTFRISVQTDDIFHRERAMIADSSAAKLPVQVPKVEEAEVEAWSAQYTALEAVLSKKLSKLACPPTVQADLKSELIRFFLDGQNLLQFFRDDYPDVYAQLQNCKNSRERMVRMASLTKNSSAPGQVQELFVEYRDRIIAEVGSVHFSNADILAYEGIADWLIRCPLDFPEPPAPSNHESAPSPV